MEDPEKILDQPHPHTLASFLFSLNVSSISVQDARLQKQGVNMPDTKPTLCFFGLQVGTLGIDKTAFGLYAFLAAFVAGLVISKRGSCQQAFPSCQEEGHSRASLRDL